MQNANIVRIVPGKKSIVVAITLLTTAHGTDTMQSVVAGQPPISISGVEEMPGLLVRVYHIVYQV